MRGQPHAAVDVPTQDENDLRALTSAARTALK
jgi:hypothetical protein